MSAEVIAAIIGAVGAILGGLPTYLIMRRKAAAEIKKIEAETQQIIAQTEKEMQEERDEFRSVSKAYRLLLIPGYDLSLILSILEGYERVGILDKEAIANARNITVGTIHTIERSMLSEGIIKQEGTYYQLTKEGTELLHDLRDHWRVS